MAMGRSAAWQAVLAGRKLMHTVIRAGKRILHGSPRFYNSTVVHVHGYPLPRLSNGAHWTTVRCPRLFTVVHVHGCPTQSGVHRPGWKAVRERESARERVTPFQPNRLMEDIPWQILEADRVASMS